ncbi:hypothetical protein FQN52_002744 [Onygenales sp. PD_12]|nr:hypothetical protein FQN52_002744 [Onygenales sp. PD_12]
MSTGKAQPLAATQPETKMSMHTTVAHACDRPCSGYGDYPLNKRLRLVKSRTHAQIIRDLEYHKSKTYCTLQNENIDAAIAYYSQLPPGSPTDGRLVWFQNGKLVSKFSDLDLTALKFLNGLVGTRQAQLPTGEWIVEYVEPSNKKDTRAAKKEGIPEFCFEAQILDTMFPRTIGGKPASAYAGISYPHCHRCKCPRPEPNPNAKLVSAESSTATLIPKPYGPSAIGPDMREKGMPEEKTGEKSASNNCILRRVGQRVGAAISKFFEKRAPGVLNVIDKEGKKY